MSNMQFFSTVAVAGLLFGGIGLGCAAEEQEPVDFSERSAQQVGQAGAVGDRDGFPPRPGQQCRGEEEGSGEWCDCMGQAIDDLTPYYIACEEVLYGEGPTDITLWDWCLQLEADFDNWWDQC